MSEIKISLAHEQLDEVVLSLVTGLQSGQTVLKDLETGSPCETFHYKNQHCEWLGP